MHVWKGKDLLTQVATSVKFENVFEADIHQIGPDTSRAPWLHSCIQQHCPCVSTNVIFELGTVLERRAERRTAHSQAACPGRCAGRAVEEKKRLRCVPQRLQSAKPRINPLRWKRNQRWEIYSGRATVTQPYGLHSETDDRLLIRVWFGREPRYDYEKWPNDLIRWRLA